jgi:translation initiation factor IF-1
MGRIKDDVIVQEGVIVDVLPGGKYRVSISLNENSTVLAIGHLSGKLKQNKINVIQGDRVRIELSTYNVSMGRITYRL